MSAKKTETKSEHKQVKLTLVNSLIGRPQTQRLVVNSLGLKKRHQTVVHYDTPIIRGMIRKVSHLLTIEEVH